MSSYPFYNEAGEPLMDGDSMRREMYYDSLYEPDPDDFYDRWDDDYEDDVNPFTCSHGDGDYPEGAGFDCANCGELLLGPRTNPVPDAYGVEWDTFFVNR